MYPQSMFQSKNKKNIKTFHLKIIFFSAVKHRRILHGRAIVMSRKILTWPPKNLTGCHKITISCEFKINGFKNDFFQLNFLLKTY